MSNALSEHWQYTTVSIEDDDERLGTGFLVGDTAGTFDQYGNHQPTWERPATRAYLVTAKHVVGNESVIATTISYTLRYNAESTHGLETRKATFEVRCEPRNWAVHPDPSIDVAVLDVTDLLPTLNDARMRFCPLSEVANPVNLMNVDCDAGDDVFVLGYPLKLRQGRSNLPIIRKGVLATSPRWPLLDEGGNPLRGFLIDGAIMPGSSGSPVVSHSVPFLPGDLEVTPNRPLLLGVVAQEWGRGQAQRYEAIHRRDEPAPSIEGYANLGFAHSASTVIETIARLGHHDPREFLRIDHDQHWAPELGVEEWALEFRGTPADPQSAMRIMLRRRRDRMRARGMAVPRSEWHDAIDIMGEIE